MKTITNTIGLFALLAVLTLSAIAQTQLGQAPKADVPTFQLGAQAVALPAPAGFEEATSQFDVIKKQFTLTEAPGNDLLAVYLPTEACEKLRAGEFGPFNTNTKVSIRSAVREVDFSAERFANLVAEYRKSGSQTLDLNSPMMKGILERLGQSASELSKQETKVDLSQPVNLGEFDTRPNIYSVMLLLHVTAKSGDGEASVPILGSVSYVRVRQRLLYVYTYRKYDVPGDVETLRDLTKKWIGQIVAAN
jgi:hypothetical protein